MIIVSVLSSTTMITTVCLTHFGINTAVSPISYHHASATVLLLIFEN
jgi:hypothetical protein